LLTRLSQFTAQIIKFSLKGFTFTALSILGLYRLGNANVSQATVKIMKAGAQSVPVVGDILSGSIKTVAIYASLIKNASGVAALITIIACVFVPFVKIAAIALSYKITAVISQPMGEKQISDCIACASDVLMLFLGVLAMLTVVFICTVLIFLSLSGG
jgi:stage III sporulation protein AE